MTVADGVVGDAARSVVVDGQVVKHDHIDIDVFLRIHLIIDRVVVRHIEVRHQVGVAVFQGVEHGGAHAEKAVVVHLVIDFWAIDFIDRVPVDAFHVKESVLLVDFVPKVIKHVDGIGGFVGFHKGAFAGSESNRGEAKEEDMQFFHGVN